MLTRRTAISAGLAFAAVACSAAVGVCGPTDRRRLEARSIDALLIDESIEMPRPMAAFIEANRQALPVVGIQLDASGQVGLMHALDKSQAVVGLSSGATLFCLERIAWDHGFRLTARSQRCAGEPGGAACRQDVAAYLAGAHGAAASFAPPARAYRPSRADGLLHAWVMERSSPQFRQNCRGIQQ
jgi:hypothetical protein